MQRNQHRLGTKAMTEIGEERMITKSKAALRASVGSLLFAALAMHSAVANAETSEDRTEASGQAAGPDYSLQEIIVTANKREESINKVGLTIKALGAAQLEQQHISSLQDLAAAVPGLQYAQTENATPVYTLRGIGYYDTTIGGQRVYGSGAAGLPRHDHACSVRSRACRGAEGPPGHALR
jgi:outer membrane receptor protein involved in Fe transport